MSSSDPALLRPSKTAELAAAIRALHLRRVSPPVFEDHLAQAMCGPFWRTVVSSGVLSRLVVDGVLRRLAPIMPAVYVRARFGEDRLEEAVGQGLEQYVIIGAGYETLAMRRADLTARLTVYELDQAATQETKRQRMRKAGIPTPEGLRYVAADLNAESLEDALDRAGFDAGRPALFSWFGVTYYLGEDAIRRTLASIAASMAPGSAVLFDYLADAASTPAGSRDLRKRCADLWRGAASPGYPASIPPRYPTSWPASALRGSTISSPNGSARGTSRAIRTLPIRPSSACVTRPRRRMRSDGMGSASTATRGPRSPEARAALAVRALSSRAAARHPSPIRVNRPA